MSSKEWAKVAGHQIKGAEGKQAVVLVPGAGLYTVDGKPVNYPISEARKRRVHVPKEWEGFFAPEPLAQASPVEAAGPTARLDLSGLQASPAQSGGHSGTVIETHQHRGVTVQERRQVGRRR